MGWILLALCVALVNSGAGLTALWILLVAVGYSLLVAYPIRWAFIYLLRRSGSLANGPTQTVVAVTVMLVLASSFFTQIIGIHAIFGAFMIGLICPHEGGFAIKLTEKIEDLISVLFLPLYFALSGLNTNLGLLNSGITWAYVVGVCAIAFIGKIAGGTLASRLNGLVWRESLTIGCLMSCKGLVELIVLNIGLQAHILSTRTFTIFVVMALITTFATTPLVVWLYPPWYQQKLELWKQGKIDWDGNRLHHDDDEDESSDFSEQAALKKTDVARKVLVYLRLDGLPSLFTMVSLFARKREDLDTLSPPSSPLATRDGGATFGGVMEQPQAMSSVVTLRRPLQVHGLRLMELTERESSVMRVSEIEEFASRDPVIKAFGTFGQSRDIAVGGQIAVVPDHSFSGTLLARARDLRSDLILLPWSETGTMSEYPNLFDAKPTSPLANSAFSSLAAEVFRKAHDSCSVGVFIDKTALTAEDPLSTTGPLETRNTKPLARTVTGMSVVEQTNPTVHFRLSDSGRYRLFVLYNGSEDDLYAVKLGLQFARNDAVDLIILNVRPAPLHHEDDDVDDHGIDEIKGTSASRHRPGDFEFETLRPVPASLNARVTFVDLDIAALDAITSAVAEPSAAETIVLVGRSTSSSSRGLASLANSGILMGGSSSSSSTAALDARALGPLATHLVRAVRDKGLSTALLVVQGRKNIDDEVGGGAPVAGTGVGIGGAVPASITAAKEGKGAAAVTGDQQ